MTRTITVKAIPNARENSISLENGVYKVRIAAPPDKNKANKELIRFLSKHFGCSVRIRSGLAARKKVIVLEE